MSTDGSKYAFENLTHSGLFKINSKEDKGVSLSYDIFNGSAGLAVWQGAGGKPHKIPLRAKARAALVLLLKNMRENIGTTSQPITILDYDREAKKTVNIGTVVVGIDETMTLFIGVGANAINGKFTFPIKGEFSWDFSQATLFNEKNQLQANIDWLISILTLETAVREGLSSFRRQPGGPGGNGGGNRGGYNSGGGNRSNWGGGNNGGGGGNRSNWNQNNGGGGNNYGSAGGVEEEILV